MKQIIAFLSLIIFSISAVPVNTKAETNKTSDPKMIRVTPPAPKFSDAERQTELAARRKAVADKMSDNSVLILFSSEPKQYAGDVDFMYRQENNLYYLTNLKQNGATFVMTKTGGSVSEFLFIPKRNPQFETWNGRMYSNEDATRISGVKTIINASEKNKFLEAFKNQTSFTSENEYRHPECQNRLSAFARKPNRQRRKARISTGKRIFQIAFKLQNRKCFPDFFRTSPDKIAV